jgi:hypothetical protein
LKSGAAALAFFAATLTASCGYHVSGRAALMPKEIKTIAVPAFGNATVRHKLARLVPLDIGRELITRSRFTLIPDPDQADAVLSGTVLTFNAYPTIFDPVSGRATGVQVVMTLQVALTERRTGKTLFARDNFDFRERYEISVDPQAYFDESGTAIERLSRDVARTVVSAILEDF